MTYRQLLEAIQTANELQRACDLCRCDPKRHRGTPEEQDEADARFSSADAALDHNIEEYWS